MNQMPPHALQYLLATILLGLAGYMVLRRHGPNPWIGVRLPWTFTDREIWDKSWLLAVFILVAAGPGAFLSWTFFIVSIIALVVIGILYPCFLYCRKYRTWRYWKDIGWLDYRPAASCLHCGHIQKLQDANELAGAHCEACGASLAR
jgi:uncharacterized membrane protein YfcA